MRKRNNYDIENSSGRWYAACCTASLNGRLVYLKQEEGKNLLHRTIILDASCYKFALVSTAFPLQWSFQLNFLVARSFSLICTPSNKESTYGAEQSALWFGCNLWSTSNVSSNVSSQRKVLKPLVRAGSSAAFCVADSTKDTNMATPRKRKLED